MRARNDGSQILAHVTLTALRDLSGSLRRFSGRTRAMSETDAARYRRLLDAVPDALVVIAETGEIVLANNLAETQFGYGRNELLGQSVANIIPRGLVPVQQIGFGLELSGRRKEGSEFPIEIMLSLLDSSKGLLMTVVVRDISERKIVQEALRASEERFRTMADNISPLAWMADDKGLIFWYSKRWFDHFGTTLEEMAGSGWQKLHHPEHVQRVASKIAHCFHKGEVYEDTFPLRGRNGNYCWFLVQAVPVRDSAGRVLRWFGTHTDINESRRMEEELLAEREHVHEAREERTRLQERFLSQVSHELRTPLTAIYFFTTNLLDGLLGDLTAGQHEQLALALNNVCQLKDMVRDLLDLTRIDTRKMTVDLGQVSLTRLITDVISTCRTTAAARHITLQSVITQRLPFVWADASRVRQILINLVDNGIKFTPEGGTVTINSPSASTGEDFLCLSVSDTGCGISPENFEIVFDRLAQLKNGPAASRPGLGLGLFITRELVLLQGGRIWVESALGRGSTFSFTLPLSSLAKLCAHIFTPTNLGAGHVTLIAVDVSAAEIAGRGDVLLEIRRVLSSCIHPGQDVLLPSRSDVEPVETYFIVACTDANGSAVISERIRGELESFDTASRLKPVISSTTLRVAKGSSREEQIGDLTNRFETLMQTHLTGPNLMGAVCERVETLIHPF
jgi:PAS domain S-box-containing protein